MQETSIKEFFTYKEIELVKVELNAFIESIDKIVSVSENDNEIVIYGELLSAYIILNKERGTDILQVPLKRMYYYKVVFCFLDKNLFNRELLKFRKIEDFLISFSDIEFLETLNSMPIINSFSQKIKNSNLNEFALIWRDHFLEENIPLLNGFEKLGVSPNWIFTLAKGDKTIKCERITAYFREHGYYDVETLPNLLDDYDTSKERINNVVDKLKQFINDARNHGKKIMLIDDGGIIANYFKDDQLYFDCAIEVTIVGIRKLKKLESIDIPIYDLGMSDLKETITYPEIAESCVKRIRELIPGEKIIGRPILILGYGTSGKHVAKIFRNIGANVGVVDVDILTLINAAEKGYSTFKSASQGIISMKPFLIVGCSGDVSMQFEDFNLLNNGTYVTGIATKDLEAIRNSPLSYSTEWLPETGYIHHINSNKYFVQLGDGQSINLFKSEAIPNRANDIFKSSILIAASELASSYKSLKGGIYLNRVNEIIEQSTLYDIYYNLYFS